MLRMWLLFGVMCLLVSSLAFAQEADDAQLPEGDNAKEVVFGIQQQLLSKGISGVETFEKQKTAFYKKYASDPNRWLMKLLEVRLLQSTGDKIGGGGRTSKEILAEINAGKDVPEEVKSDVSALNVQAIAADVATGKAKVADLIAATEQHFAHYPRARTNRGLLHLVVDAVGSGEDADKQLVALGKSSIIGIGELVEAKQKVLKVRKELTTKPLELTFKAVDGREVDLAKMRGKVVLVDFWATWCGPCMAEVPNIVSTYKRLKGQGFEVVGISLDQDEAALKQVVADKEMAWPQFFHDKEGEHPFAEKYGINSIPEMWLIDKKGMVKIHDHRQNLAEEVAKLLAE